jgi:hypothetical protein
MHAEASFDFKASRFGRTIDRLPMKDPKIQREARHYDPAAREYVQQYAEREVTAKRHRPSGMTLAFLSR